MGSIQLQVSLGKQESLSMALTMVIGETWVDSHRLAR